MKSSPLNYYRSFISILFIWFLGSWNVASQIPGSLFMNTDNFYSQMYNPAYQRNDKVTSFSFAGFAGLNFINQGNFKISDLIVLDSQNNPVIDIENFYGKSKKTNIIRQNLSVPVAFLSIPVKKGTISFFYKENISSIETVNKEVFGFLLYGNEPEKYKSFNTGELKMNGVGYREFAFGFSGTKKDGFDYGIRAKLLFGGTYLKTSNWIYGIETNADATQIQLTALGKGGFMVPVPVLLNPDKTMHIIEPEGFVKKYFTEYGNPGMAFDAGIKYTIGKKQVFSAAVNDVGGIFFKRNNFDMTTGGNYNYYGFDLTNAVRYLDPGENGYLDPNSNVESVKDSIVTIYLPMMNEVKSWYGLSPKLLIHYNYNLSENLSFGLTNQAAYQAGGIRNVLTAGSMQQWKGFSFFESFNLHDVSDVSVGGGFQYEGRFVQVFVASDNILAFYHPANNKTFTFTFGMCFLVGKEKDSDTLKKAKIKGRRGKTSEFLPFYEDLR